MPRRTLIKVAVLLVLAGAVTAIWFSPVRSYLTMEHIRAFVERLRGLWYGPLAFIGVFAVSCVLALPASVFVIAAGFIWGGLLGGIYSMIGGLLGAIASFYVGRFVGEGLLDRFGKIGRAAARQVDHAGFKSMLILRFIPGIPFAVLNYGAGVAGVRFRDYFFSTLLGIGPAMFVFAYCADALFNGSMSQGDAFKRLILVCGVVLVMVVVVPAIGKRFAKKQIEN
jgi:uncharacterized membrane protein YdjX (TVP38/TMEM64 family)